MRDIFVLVGRITTEGFKETNKKLRQIDKEAKAATRGLAAMGRQAVKTGKDLSKKLTVPMIAAGATVLKFGADFERAMTNSLAIMGDISDAMRKDMEGAARAVAKTTKFSATQAAEAYYFLASAGLDAAASIKALPQVAQFAQAGNFDLARATDLLTDAQSALGLSSKDAAENQLNMARVSDVLVKANTMANASVEQFSESLTNKAGAALRLLGKDVEEGAAVLAVYADQGLKGAEAGNALNIMMRDLQKASLNNRDAFDAAGISVFDSAGEMRNLADIVADLENRFSGMSDEQKRAELMALGFTDKSVSATAALIGTSKAIRQYESGLRSASGITDEVAKKQIQNLWDQLGLLKDRLIDVGLTLYDAFGKVLIDSLFPILDKIVEKLSMAAEWFNNLSDDTKETILFMTGLVAAIGPVLIIVGKLVPVVTTLVKAYKLWMAAQGALNVALTLTGGPIGLVITAIGALIAAGYLLIKNWDKVAYFFKQMFNGLKIGAISFAKIFVDLINVYAKHIPFVGDMVEKLSGKLDGLIQKEKENMAATKAARVAEIENKKAMEEAAKAAKEEADAINAATKATNDNTDANNKNAASKGGESPAKVTPEWMRLNKEWRDRQFEENLQRQRDEMEEIGRINEEARRKDEDDEKAHNDRIREQRRALADFSINMVRDIGAVFTSFNENRMAEIDNETAKEKEAVLNSVMSEEEKQAAIANIDERAEVKKRKLRQQQAKQEKALAIFNIGVSTAQAIMKAFAQLGPFAVAATALIASFGAAQIAAVASKPIPMDRGGLVPAQDGGVPAIIGEGREDEIVMPLQSGIDKIVQGITSGISGAVLPSAAPAGAGGRLAAAAGPTGGVIVVNIGHFFGTENEYKQLERRLLGIRIQEGQRKGRVTDDVV